MASRQSIVIYCDLLYGNQERPFTLPMFTDSSSCIAATRNQLPACLATLLADGTTSDKLVKLAIFSSFILMVTNTNSLILEPRTFPHPKRRTSCLSLKLPLLKKVRLLPRPVKLLLLSLLTLLPRHNPRGVSGIQVESRERVTFAPTSMKRFHDLQQFRSHWTR